jgi:hypothetical protein
LAFALAPLVVLLGVAVSDISIKSQQNNQFYMKYHITLVAESETREQQNIPIPSKDVFYTTARQ